MCTTSGPWLTAFSRRNWSRASFHDVRCIVTLMPGLLFSNTSSAARISLSSLSLNRKVMFCAWAGITASAILVAANAPASSLRVVFQVVFGSFMVYLLV